MLLFPYRYISLQANYRLERQTGTNFIRNNPHRKPLAKTELLAHFRTHLMNMHLIGAPDIR